MISKKLVLNIIEGVIFACLLIFIIAAFGSCKAKDVPVQKIKEALLSDETTAGLSDKEDFSVNQSFAFIPTEYVYIKSNEVMDVREIFIAKTASDEEMEKVEQAVSKRLEDQIGNFTNYGTDQLSMLENAVTFEKGNYYFYAVGENADKWSKMFSKLVG